MKSLQMLYKELFLKATSFSIGIGALILIGAPSSWKLNNIALILVWGCILAWLLYFMTWCFKHKIQRGLKYALLHAEITNKLHRSLVDAKITSSIIKDTSIVCIPFFKVTLFSDMNGGLIEIKSSLKDRKLLDDIELSCALPSGFIAESPYLAEDNHWYIIEFNRAKLQQVVFTKISDFIEFCKNYSKKEMFIDEHLAIPITHALIAGATRSGKTYAIYNILLQLLIKTFEIYIVAPKLGDLLIVGNSINKEKTAGYPEDIIKLIDDWSIELEARLSEYTSYSSGQIDSNYLTYGLQGKCLVIDEYGSLKAFLSTQKKEIRDKVESTLTRSILMGAEIGMFVIIATQQPSASILNTSIRENCGLHLCFSSGEETYRMVFDSLPENSRRRFLPGQGLLSLHGVIPNECPKTIWSPKLDFNVVEAISCIKDCKENF